ncbi:CpsB/CapC family capsule biosynthesis tyrosine phosphatase [Ferriphaselus sp. R-1]|uniref:tyrosine-protein phosphatase n=1 Tax=Ferriphaselus sp. R-1 TaxID=1485544 RepID=UPI00055533B7|nr:CpsB/CapC family capsule biosynthesis tyrosine phosphatase [Ferriphaselus sp. R-1]
MIDLHCHFLPGIDDGAETIEQALELARVAVVDGITVAAMTPHVHVGRYENTRTNIVKKTEAFQRVLEHKGITLKVYPAGEVRLNYEVVDLVTAGEAPFLGELDGYRIMLLEFPHSQIPVGADKLVQWLFSQKIRPLIAHPERNKEVMRSHAKVEPFINMGCMLQVTAGSLVGQFGAQAKAAAEYFLAQNWVSVLATDAHDAVHRPPNLSLAKDLLVAQGKSALATRLLETTPARILGIGQ